MQVSGQVIDNATGDPVPGATVELWFGNVMLNRSAANSNGFFSVESSSSPNSVRISSASYLPGSFSYPTSNKVFELVRNVKEGEPVIVTSILKGSKGWLWLGLLVLVVLSKKRI